MDSVKAFAKKYWGTVVVLLVMFLGYKFVTDNELVDKVLFPTVDRIWDAFMLHAPEFPMNFISSMTLLVPSLIIGTAIALAFGIVLGTHKRLRDTLYPIVYAISVIPAILLSPFALYLAPTFASASVFLIVYNTIWATLFATITGIMTIDKRYLDNADTLCLTGWKRLTKVMLPAAMPSILSGFVTSLRSSFLVLVFAEMYSAQWGMGFFVKKNSDFGLYDNTWAGFLFMIIVLVIVMQIFEKVKNHLLKWTID
ncbi:MAG: ABC transporter permease subunit [Coriobacteriia bacterium]|nr:ABC transporter permease subunit [Coriobacteriia bacterium]